MPVEKAFERPARDRLRSRTNRFTQKRLESLCLHQCNLHNRKASATNRAFEFEAGLAAGGGHRHSLGVNVERNASHPPRRSLYLAVAAAGASAFIDMYATQPLLPELRRAFAASEAEVSATVSALIFATACAALAIGPLADRIGRKRIIVTSIALLGVATLATATAQSLPALVAWRFVQGIFMPGIFTVTLAYIAEEFPANLGGRAVGAYVGGNVFGGFAGRYLSALVAAHSSWHVSFVVLGVLNFAGAAVVFAALPRAAHFTRATSFAAAFRAMARFVRNPVLLATYAIGGASLFTIVAAFTYATFYLAAPPFALGTAALGNVFFVYLAGVVAVPLSGRLVDRVGHRATALLCAAVAAAGITLTLVPTLPAVLLGLALMASGTFCVQATSQGYVGVVAAAQRSSAAALYIATYYAGGGIGALAPAAAWTYGGWPATVALIFAVQIAIGVLAVSAWPPLSGARRPPLATPG
ncbi:MAG: MFS transporter [Candidatus Velthaea sp.]